MSQSYIFFICKSVPQEKSPYKPSKVYINFNLETTPRRICT